MFEKTMLEQLTRIFGLPATYAKASDSQEQQGLFIQVERARARIKDARQIARVVGKVSIFADLEKMPFGYITKCIDAAAPADTSGFFFYDLEENAGTLGTIAERSASFVYLFDSQYDPDIGTLNEIDLTYAES